MSPPAERPPLLLDACGALNVAAAFGLERAESELERRLPILSQAAREVLYLYEDVDGERRRVDVDVGPLEVVDLTDAETDDFVSFTQRLGDGEAATLAAAKHRRLPVLTDDRLARRVAATLDPPVLTMTTPRLLSEWSSRRAVSSEHLGTVLAAVEQRACFVPRRSDPDALWWHSARTA